VTARRPTWAHTGPEYKVAPGDWTETKTVIPAVVVADYLLAIGDGTR
jgi:hypothetical protein